MKNWLFVFIVILMLGCNPKPLQFEKAVFSERNAEMNYEIAIVYPAFSGPDAKFVNELVYEKMQDQITNFKTLVTDLEPASLSNLEGNFSVRFNDYPFLSVESRFEMAVPGTPILLRSYHNINFHRSKVLNYGSAKDILINEPAENVLFKAIQQAWRAGHEDLPCELNEETSFDDFTFNGKDFLFYVNLYAGNPVCQWELIRVEASQISDILKPELKQLLSLEQVKSLSE